MKKYLFLLFIVSLTSCSSKKDKPLTETDKVNLLLNNWHNAAAETNFNNYFEAMTEDAIFIGTDATENWNKTEFQAFAKPYFDKGKAWNFKTLERNIYFNPDNKIAWFDELLDTQMKICRGSGVIVKTNEGWKIKHYVLSMTIPNDDSNAVIKIKTQIEDQLIKDLKEKK